MNKRFRELISKHTNPDSYSNPQHFEHLRRRRLEFLLERVNYSEGSYTLDVGCGREGYSVERFLKQDRIVGIDLYPEDQIKIDHPDFRHVRRDARDLSMFADNEFDIAFCIGMLEHITDTATLESIAKEVRRVAKKHAIVVPHKYSVIEQHFKLPLFSVYPHGLKVSLVKLLNLHGLKRQVEKKPDCLRTNYQWLGKNEWRRCFPESDVHVIRSFLLFWCLAIIGASR